MPSEGGGHKTYFQGAIGFLLGDEGANLNRPVPRAVGEKHINDLLGRHPFHPYDPSIDDSIPTTVEDVKATGGASDAHLNPSASAAVGGGDVSLLSTTAPIDGNEIADSSTSANAQTLAALDKKFIDHAWACLRRKEARDASAGGTTVESEAENSAPAGAGSYLNLPYLTRPQEHPCYSQNKLFGMCMRDDEKSEMELFMKHVNCFHPYKVDLMKCITKYTRTDRLKKQQQQNEGGSGLGQKQ